MDIEEIRKMFAEKSEQGYMDKEKTVPIEVYRAKLLDIIVTMKNDSKITILCGEKEEFIDLTNENPNRYVGFGSTLISPMKDIKNIELNWR